MQTILITGCAGFIGAAICEKLLQEDYFIIGIDNLNSYYDINLKKARLARLTKQKNFIFYLDDIKDAPVLIKIFKQHQPQYVIHLAAQAGVRYSIDNPGIYIESNLVGFFNLLEACRQVPVEHLVFASSSSVYGNQTEQPFSTTAQTDAPLSLYAATKKSNELLAHAYSHLYHIPMTGLRYFTVYGPWGRPDMASITFAARMLAQQAIPVFNQGAHKRDFTYIDDIVSGTLAVLKKMPNANPPYRIFNIGSGRPIALMDFIRCLEKTLDCKAILDYQDKQMGDVDETWADIADLTNAVGYQPSVSLADGLANFATWYKSYYIKAF